jgi:hypothetical protein
MVGNIGNTASQGQTSAAHATATEQMTNTEPVLKTLPGREQVARGGNLKFTYTYKNNTAKLQQVGLRRTLETAGGKVLYTYVGARAVPGGKDFAQVTNTTIPTSWVPGQYVMRVKITDSRAKGTPVLAQDAFTFTVTK